MASLRKSNIYNYSQYERKDIAMATIYDYIYGVYLSFACSGEGGGETDPTNVLTQAGAAAQTGDFVFATIIAVLAIALILATGVFFVRKLKHEIFGIVSSKPGILAKFASAKKVLVVAIFAFSVFCIIAYLTTARAFADSTNETVAPAAPPYSHATAVIDKESGEVSVDNVHISDSYCKDNSLHASIVGIRISTINGFDPKDLGTWNVSVDGFDVYSGPPSCQYPFVYPVQKSGELDICLSADGISADVYEKLNGNLGVVVELLVDRSHFIPHDDIPGKSEVSVSLAESPTNDSNKIDVAKPEEFKSYIESKGWIFDEINQMYKNKFPTYTSYSEILETWNYALEVGMLKNNSTQEFYQWENRSLEYRQFLFVDEVFLPVWYPEDELVDIVYHLDKNCNLTPYGETVLAEHNWEFHSSTEPGGEDVYIDGKISNRTDVEEINAILNSNCFSIKNGFFAGWQITKGKLFQNYTPFNNFVLILPIYVSINGKVVNQQGVGQPNICVGMEIIDLEHKYSTGLNYGSTQDHTAITDSNGNYYMLVERGASGMLRFGIDVFDSLDNKYSGEALLLNNIQEQTIKTVTVYNNTMLLVDIYQQNSTNDVSLEYGHVKFITHDPSGNEVVFYSDRGAISSRCTIYTLANAKGKLIYESPTLYGEVDVDNTGDGSKPKELSIFISKKTKTDCVVHGKVYCTNQAGETSIIAGNKINIYVWDEITGGEEQIIIEKTGNDGSYSFSGYKGTYITRADCLDASGDVLYSYYYSEPVLIDETSFNHDIYFKEVTALQQES